MAFIYPTQLHVIWKIHSSGHLSERYSRLTSFNLSYCKKEISVSSVFLPSLSPRSTGWHASFSLSQFILMLPVGRVEILGWRSHLLVLHWPQLLLMPRFPLNGKRVQKWLRMCFFRPVHRIYFCTDEESQPFGVQTWATCVVLVITSRPGSSFCQCDEWAVTPLHQTLLLDTHVVAQIKRGECWAWTRADLGSNPTQPCNSCLILS